MKKILLIVFLLIACFYLFPDDTYPFLTNYAAKNIAIGYSGGIADVWASNSANNSGNPALLGYQNGLSYRYSHGDHYFTDVNESVLSFGYKGVGIALPMPSYKGNFGFVHHFDYDLFIGFFLSPDIEEFHYYEVSNKFSLGINLIEFISNFNNANQAEKPYEFSLGFSHNTNTVKYKIVTQVVGIYTPEVNFATQDYGANFRIDPFRLFDIDSLVEFGVSAGVHVINPTRIKYRLNVDNDLDGQLNEDPDDGIDNDGDGDVDEDGVEEPKRANYDTRMAAAVHAELPLKKVSNAPPTYFLYHFSKNFLSLTLNAETGNDYESLGGEFSLLDIFYYRTGYYEEYNWVSMVNELKTTTSGFGIKLNYEDIISLEYNGTSIDEGSLFFPFEMYDIGLNVNFMKLIGKKN